MSRIYVNTCTKMIPSVVWDNFGLMAGLDPLTLPKPVIQLFNLSTGRYRICPRVDQNKKHGRDLLLIRRIHYKISEFPQFYSENVSFGTKKISADKKGPIDRQRKFMSSEDSLSRHWTEPSSDGWPLSNRMRTLRLTIHKDTDTLLQETGGEEGGGLSE